MTAVDPANTEGYNLDAECPLFPSQLKVFKEVSAPVKKKKNKKPATLSTVNINPLLGGLRSNLTYSFQRLTAQSIEELKI